MADPNQGTWATGLLGNYLDGLDEKDKHTAVGMGLLNIGSGLLSQSGPGGSIAQGFAQGAQQAAALPQQLQQQAYMRAVMGAKLADMKRTQAEQDRRDKYFKSAFGDGETPQAAGSFLPSSSLANGQGPTIANAQSGAASGTAPLPAQTSTTPATVGGLRLPPGLSREMAAMLGPDATYRMMIDYNTKLAEKGLEAPKVETIYDKATGREVKQYFDPTTRQWVTQGGVKAPDVGTGMVYENGQAQFVPGYAEGQTRFAGAKAGIEANARNASDTAFAGAKAYNTAMGGARAELTPVQVGDKQMPLAQAKPYLNELGKTQGDMSRPQKVENDLRQEFTSLQPVKNYREVVPIMKSMEEAAGRNTKASDLNMVYGLAKMMDPNSVVREGEMVMVKNAGALPDWLVGSINGLNGGAQLQPNTRDAVMTEARSRYSAIKGAHDEAAGVYRGMSQRYNVNPDNVLVDISGAMDAPQWRPSSKKSMGARGSAPNLPALPSGFTIVQ